MTQQILAWHNDPKLKADAVERMRKHKADDDFMRGEYVYAGPDPLEFRGCFHGCLTAERYAAEHDLTMRQLDAKALRGRFWHREGERYWGIPEALGALLDNVFEGHANNAAAGVWAVAATEAIPVGADLTGVAGRFIEGYDQRRADDDADLMLRLLAEAPVVAR